MSNFTALNVEPDDNLNEDFDNTKEIQIEEALKLYQTALKLHSQGPKFYDQAIEAYENLFRSEVFGYPESVTEFARLDGHPELDIGPESAPFTGAELAASVSELSASTLPQLLFLSNKNHGQFIIDNLKRHLKKYDDIPKEILLSHSQKALDHFCKALARDESDTELWRRAARIGATIGSRAVTRYCLEAAVEVDDDPTLGEVEPAGLEEGFAGAQLKKHLQVLSDDVALSHPIMLPYEKKDMSGGLKKYMDPYPFLPTSSSDLEKQETIDSADLSESRLNVELPERSWCSLGDVLWRSSLEHHASGKGVLIVVTYNEHEAIEVSVSPKEAIQLDQSHNVGSESSTKEATPTSNGFENLKSTSNVPNLRNDEETQNGRPSLGSHDNNNEQESNLVLRKRSQSAAGIQDTPDEETGAQKRSKRIRNRDTTSLSADGPPPDPQAQYLEQLREVRQADHHVFAYINSLMHRLNINGLGTLDSLHEAMMSDLARDRTDSIQNTAVRDLYNMLQSWNETKAALLINGGVLDALEGSADGANAGILALLELSTNRPKRTSDHPVFSETADLDSFINSTNRKLLPLQDVVYEFMKAIHPSYGRELWSDNLRHIVYKLVNDLDSYLFRRLEDEFLHLKSLDNNKGDLRRLRSISQMLFEVQLALNSSYADRNSWIDPARIKKRESLDRWQRFTANIFAGHQAEPEEELSLRYLWSSAFFTSLADGVAREHVIACWNDIRMLLEAAGNPVIELPNNLVIPEISKSAAEREISKLTSTDFFLNLFQSDNSDPVMIIETLEPVLDPPSIGLASPHAVDDAQKKHEGTSFATTGSTSALPSGLRDMWTFLRGGNSSLRLFLWQRLREAYESIGYKTKVFSCYLKSLEILVGDLTSSAYVDSSSQIRQNSLLSWFKTLDDLLVKALTLALNDPTAFDIIDDGHIKSSCSAVAQLCRILHSAALYDDAIRVGMLQVPRSAEYSLQGTFGTALIKLREMQVRSWSLLYCLLKDGMAQHRELFTTIDDDLADYMAAVHYSLGLRKYCKVSNKIFLKMMKVEMVRMKNVERWIDYMGQLLYDLYGIKLGTGLWELQDHGCPTEPLDKRTTITIADRIVVLASSMSMKDLLKAELRPTIEKMQQAVGITKTTPQMQHNLRNYTDYLKSSINPLRLSEAFLGKVYVDSIPVLTSESPLADKGWYFLLGMMALTRFRSQKRLSPGATDDLKIAASFFRLQLQFTSELWETWYRLAQCFDAELEEDILWSAEKLNSDRHPLIQLQRSAIHCYVMALSTAMRSAENSLETASKLSDMYHDFGARIYSSSREPFTMEAFYLDDFSRHFSGEQGMYKKPAHVEMTRFKAWKYAARLFRRALQEMPRNWMSHYLHGKCLWKMYTKVNDEPDRRAWGSRPAISDVIAAFEKAVDTVPKPRDSRSEPIFEPHYKIMAVAHKLVMRGELQPQEAANILQRQPYAVRKGEPVIVADTGAWGTFILDSIRHLRNIDKSNWHHRMIFRVATIVCPANEPTFAEASLARAELKDSMFTKTMVVQVWKPEYERPGRHCVYMERYVRFMIKLLKILEDKPNMEALVKRVRKKQVDYYHFTEVWTECCNVYMRMIRRAGTIPINQDEHLRLLPIEDFHSTADVLEEWAANPLVHHPALDCLREAVDLKKQNAGLMKPGLIDELINDAYAILFLSFGVHLPRPAPAAPLEPRSQGPMSLNNLVSNMDTPPPPSGPSDPAAAVRPRKAGVSRKDITRYAETAASRATDPVRPIPPLRARGSDPSVPWVRTPVVAVPVRKGGAGMPESGGVVSAGNVAANAEEEGEDAYEDADVEPQGSLHDSADDESDLSDVPEAEAEPEPVQAQVSMFPNLKVGAVRGGSGSGSEGQGEEKMDEEML